MVLTLGVTAARAEVTVQLAVPGDPALQPEKTLEIAASQVDGILGNATFSQRVADVFASLAALREDAKAFVGEFLLSDPRTRKIQWISAETDPLAIRLRQNGSGIDIRISGLVVTARVKVDEGNLSLDKEIFSKIFCPEIKYTLKLYISAIGRFRSSDLTLEALTVPRPSYQITHVSCTGVLGPIGAALDELIKKGVGDRLRQRFAEAFQAHQNFGSLNAMVSLGDLVARLDQAVPSGPIKDRVMAVVDRFLYLASQPAFLQLDIELHENLFGSGSHLIRIAGSSIPPDDVLSIDYPLVTWFGGTPPYDVYLDTGSSINRVTTTAGTTWVGPTTIHAGTRVLVISTNPVVAGLKSFPTQEVINFVRGGAGCPECVLR